ncbi:MAG: diguanylate cyclase [Oscillospiraceae bacterium]
MKVKTLIFSLFVSLAIIPLLLFGVNNILSYHNQMTTLLENDLGIITNMQEQVIENFLQERSKNANVIADVFSVGTTLKQNKDITEEQKEKILALADKMLMAQDSAKDYINAVCAFDLDFNVLASSETVPNEFISTMKSIPKETFTNKLKFLPSKTSAFSDKKKEKCIIALCSIYDGKKKTGHLAMEINMDFFEKVRSTIKLYNGGTVYLLDENKQIIVAGDNKEKRDEYVLSKSEREDFNRAMIEEDFSSGVGVLRYKARNHDIISSYATIKSTDWLLLVSVDVDATLQTKTKFIYLCIFVAAVFIALIIGSSYIISKKIARPLENIIDKFEYIKKNKDYSVRVEVPRNNEISIISEGINGLLDSVEQHIAQENEVSKKLLERVLRDPLTGLYNKKAMDKLITEKYAKCSIANSEIAICYLDIDDFKFYNTQYGHSNGDEVLQYVAKVIASQEECSARVGGDEFVICITDAQKLRDIEYIAKDIIATLNVGMEFAGEDTTVRIGCCIGIALVNAGTVTTREMLDAADKAMYKVKNENKNGVLILRENEI